MCFVFKDQDIKYQRLLKQGRWKEMGNVVGSFWELCAAFVRFNDNMRHQNVMFNYKAKRWDDWLGVSFSDIMSLNIYRMNLRLKGWISEIVW